MFDPKLIVSQKVHDATYRSRTGPIAVWAEVKMDESGMKVVTDAVSGKDMKRIADLMKLRRVVLIS